MKTSGILMFWGLLALPLCANEKESLKVETFKKQHPTGFTVCLEKDNHYPLTYCISFVNEKYDLLVVRNSPFQQNSLRWQVVYGVEQGRAYRYSMTIVKKLDRLLSIDRNDFKKVGGFGGTIVAIEKWDGLRVEKLRYRIESFEDASVIRSSTNEVLETFIKITGVLPLWDYEIKGDVVQPEQINLPPFDK